jgi:thiol-disulfide isomerase/thioredoxin
MGKASKDKRGTSRSQLIATQRAASRRAEVRRRVMLAAGSIVAVVAVVLTFVLVKANSGPGTAPLASNGPTGTALASVIRDVTTVPASVLDKVGAGTIDRSGVGSVNPAGADYIAPVSGPSLTSGGKPELLYIGADYCPYCAAERWAMIVALSRFGTFSGLSTIHSSTTDSPADIPSWTFFGSKYTSKYLTFTSVEETQNYRKGNSAALNVGYVPLQTPTAAQQALLEQYDTSGYIPFLDVANKYVEVGNLLPYGPQVLQGLSWSQIAQSMRDPSSTVAQCVDASANYLTAAILKATGNQPASACTPAVKALETRLG